MGTFIKCFKIAKRNKGVLFWREHNTIYNPSSGRFSYSICKDLNAEMIFDFREGTGSRFYGKELNNEDRKLFYNVKQ